MLFPKSSRWSPKLEALCCRLRPSAQGPSDQWVLYTLSPGLGYPLSPELLVSLTQQEGNAVRQDRGALRRKSGIGGCQMNKIQLSPSMDVSLSRIELSLLDSRANAVREEILHFKVLSSLRNRAFQLSQPVLPWGTCTLPGCSSGWHRKILFYMNLFFVCPSCFSFDIVSETAGWEETILLVGSNLEGNPLILPVAFPWKYP